MRAPHITDQIALDATPLAQVSGPAPFATVTSSFVASSSVSLEEVESSEGVPFRRDLNSVVAQNIPTLMETKTNSGIPGFEAFAEAVRQGLANGKRDLVKLFARNLVARDSEGSDIAACGGRLSCFWKGQGGISTRDSQTADCGGRLSCFKKRIMGEVNVIPRDSQTAECGGRLSCFKKRMINAFFTRNSQRSTAGCTVGRFSCLMKRILDNFHLRRLLKHLPATSSAESISMRSATAEPEAMYDPTSLAPREADAEPQIFHTCDGGLCFDAKDKVEKRTVDESTVKTREATAVSQTGGPGDYSCGRFECMEEPTVEVPVKPRDATPEQESTD